MGKISPLAVGAVSEVDTIIEYRCTYNLDDWYTAYAKAKTAAGDASEGARFARLAVEENEANYRARLALGEACFDSGQLQEARRAYEMVNTLVRVSCGGIGHFSLFRERFSHCSGLRT